MRYLRILAILGMCFVFAPYAYAQRVVVGVGIGAPAYVGAPPVCSYGYYPNYPYTCAPYGYYGPSWFSGGIFIGAGPWFRGGLYGGRGFYGARGFVGGHGGFVTRGPVGGFRGGAAVRGGGSVGAFRGGAAVR